ncbi:LapA family protein [Salana multivorans]
MARIDVDATDDGWSFGAFLKTYWLSILLSILAIVFIVQNTRDVRVALLMLEVDAPAWLVYAVLVVIGIIIGWFAHRRRIKKRAAR